MLPDGRILYTRWEYVDRSQVEFHHLWTINPDGSGETVYFGNMHPGIVMIDAKPIPDSREVLVNFSPGHGSHRSSGTSRHRLTSSTARMLEPTARQINNKGPDQGSLSTVPTNCFWPPNRTGSC